MPMQASFGTFTDLFGLVGNARTVVTPTVHDSLREIRRFIEGSVGKCSQRRDGWAEVNRQAMGPGFGNETEHVMKVLG
jgi:hypothetical protein